MIYNSQESDIHRYHIVNTIINFYEPINKVMHSKIVHACANNECYIRTHMKACTHVHTHTFMCIVTNLHAWTNADTPISLYKPNNKENQMSNCKYRKVKATSTFPRK